MAAVAQACDDVMAAGDHKAKAQQLLVRVELAAETIAQKMVELVEPGQVIMTISTSATVQACLTAAKKAKGISLAESIESADQVWVGADTIGDEFFINAVGTYALVCAAKELGIPIYVLADTTKKGLDTVVDPRFETIPLAWVKWIAE